MRSRVNKRTHKEKKIIPDIANKITNIEINYVFLLRLAITILLYVILFFGITNFSQRAIAISKFESNIESFAQKNSDTLFEVTEMTLYSSASARKNSQTVGMDISTFTDISFNISNLKNMKVNSLKISNISIDTVPEIGTAVLNYKNPFDFGKLTNFDLESAQNIEYNVTDEETGNFEKPTMYNNLSTPITLTYLNKDIYRNFQVRLNETSIYYNGRLLNSANIDITKLKATISFNITINDKYTCRLYIDIPYKTDKNIITDGYVKQNLQLNGTGKFYQV